LNSLSTARQAAIDHFPHVQSISFSYLASEAPTFAMDPFRAYAKHVNPALGRFLELTGRGTRFVRAQGASIEDEGGNAYDDFLAGFGSLNLGHNPPRIKAAIQDVRRGVRGRHPLARRERRRGAMTTSGVLC
jgi:hypothetical protein